MKKAFFISLSIHLLLFMLLYIAALFSEPLKPPQKIYSVKILGAPIPEQSEPESKKPAKKMLKEPKPKPKVIEKPKPKLKSKPVEKPKSTKQNRSSKDLVQGKASVQVEGKDFANDFYLNLIINKVANNWLNPLRGGRTISAVIYFKIQRSGKVTDAVVEKSSGNQLFDQSALRAVLASSPLPSLPESYTGDFLGVHFQFEHKS
ncbi:hypothetical protein DRQ33_06215, partial [bacterium]